MRGFVSFIAVLGALLVLGFPSPASARVATIRTTAPIVDPSEVSIQTALVEAVEAATRGALAMGLPHVRLSQAVLLPGSVLVEVIASDRDGDDETDIDETGTSAGRSGRVLHGRRYTKSAS
jgi:hypothetical protein